MDLATSGIIPKVVLGPIQLAEKDFAGRQFIAGASGVANVNGSTFVVSDELAHFAKFTAPDLPGTLTRAVPDNPAKPGKQPKKTDIETIVPLGPADASGAVKLLALGSGSNSTRERGFITTVDANGAAAGQTELLNLSGMYESIRTNTDIDLNIEAAVAKGNELVIFHRGGREGSNPAEIRLDMTSALISMKSGEYLPREAIHGVRDLDFGDKNGVKYGVSDALLMPDSSIVLSLSAEGRRIEGSAITRLLPDGRGTRVDELAGSPVKIEGITLSGLQQSAGSIGLLAVTDNDTPDQAAEFLLLNLPIA